MRIHSKAVVRFLGLLVIVGMILLLAPSGSVRGEEESGGTAMSAPGDDPSTVDPTAFAFRVYGALRTEPGNLFFSPYSLHMALSMTVDGARGTTRRGLTSTLLLPADDDARHARLVALQELRTQEGDFVTLSIANRLWGQEGYPFAPAYTEQVEKVFGAALESVDFADSTAAAERINAWVKAETRGMIENLVQPDLLGADTRLVLTNAIYFLGTWEDTFEPDETMPRPFHVFDLPEGATPPEVPMMHAIHHHSYYEDSDCMAIRLPYMGWTYEMMVLLPKEPTKEAFTAMEADLTSDRIARMQEDFKDTRVVLRLPKWKMAWEGAFRDVLARLGMAEAFDPDAADFSGMVADGSRDLFISEVLQKAAIDVTETGTEAGAATAVLAPWDDTEHREEERPTPFHADRPFVYLIRHRETGTILFLGRMLMPEGE